MKSLLPATTDFSNQEINVMDDGKFVMEPSNLFNAFFSTPVLPQPALAAAQEDFSSHLSVSFHFIFHLFIRHKGYKREKKMKKKKSYCLQSHGEEAQKKPAGL